MQERDHGGSDSEVREDETGTEAGHVAARKVRRQGGSNLDAGTGGGPGTGTGGMAGGQPSRSAADRG
jgi:hypothetical protein